MPNRVIGIKIKRCLFQSFPKRFRASRVGTAHQQSRAGPPGVVGDAHPTAVSTRLRAKSDASAPPTRSAGHGSQDCSCEHTCVVSGRGAQGNPADFFEKWAARLAVAAKLRRARRLRIATPVKKKPREAKSNPPQRRGVSPLRVRPGRSCAGWRERERAPRVGFVDRSGDRSRTSGGGRGHTGTTGWTLDLRRSGRQGQVPVPERRHRLIAGATSDGGRCPPYEACSSSPVTRISLLATRHSLTQTPSEPRSSGRCCSGRRG